MFVEVFTIQHFTNYLYLGGDPFKAKQINRVAKVFYVVSRAVAALRKYYYPLRLRLSPKSARLLPSPTYLPGSSPFRELVFTGRFSFEGRKPDDYRRSLFRGTYGGNTVLIKFCEGYGEVGHRMLASLGLAPSLHFCSVILGDVVIVVMDLVDGQCSYHGFKHQKLPQTVLDDVKHALQVLHAQDLVFGDLRRPNLMVVNSRGKGEEEQRGLLVDFDWAGKLGKAKYPPGLNISGEIDWADGAAPDVKIEKEHDLGMLEKLINGTL